jgi:hypothetical protein
VVFSFTASEKELVVTTKCQLLSRIATILDPFQFLAPIVITGKITLQKTWLRGLDWDEKFPMDLQKIVDKWTEQMLKMSAVTIPRCYRSRPIDEVQDVTFSDASKVAYAAVSYIRVEFTDGQIEVNVVAAKA